MDHLSTLRGSGKGAGAAFLSMKTAVCRQVLRRLTAPASMTIFIMHDSWRAAKRKSGRTRENYDVEVRPKVRILRDCAGLPFRDRMLSIQSEKQRVAKMRCLAFVFLSSVVAVGQQPSILPPLAKAAINFILLRRIAGCSVFSRLFSPDQEIP